MPTIEDLGKELRKVFPGKFNGFSDEEIGRKAKRAAEKKGLHDYDTYEENQSLDIVSQSNGRNLVKELINIATNSRVKDQAQSLFNELDPKKGWFSSWFLKKRAIRNTELVRIVGQNALTIMEQGLALETRAAQHVSEMASYQTFIRQYELTLLEIQAKEHLIQAALDQGMTMPEYIQTQTEKELSNIRTIEHITTTTSDTRLAIEKEKELTEIKTKAYINKAEADLKVEVDRARAEMEFEIITKHLTNYQQANQLQKLIEVNYVEIDDIHNSKIIPEGAKPAIIRSRERYIEKLMERQEKLLETSD